VVRHARRATPPRRSAFLRAASDFIRSASKKEKDEGRGVNRKVVNISSIAGLYGNADRWAILRERRPSSA